MLFFLTGEVQIGKTRWLMDAIAQLAERGVEPCGVIAPGQWVPRDGGFEKLGIDNMLLPGRQLIPFARRRDLAEANGALDERSQSEQAHLQWAIDDNSIAQVNAHFDALSQWHDPGKRLLVVDELGRLEVLADGGLTSAVALLDRGATPVFPHALIVVRAGLLDVAHERFSIAPWNGMHDIAPDEAALQMLASNVAGEA